MVWLWRWNKNQGHIIKMFLDTAGPTVINTPNIKSVTLWAIRGKDVEQGVSDKLEKYI